MKSQLLAVSEHETENEGLDTKSKASLATKNKKSNKAKSKPRASSVTIKTRIHSNESGFKFMSGSELKLPRDVPCVDPSDNEHYIRFLVCDFDQNKTDSYATSAASLYDGQNFISAYENFKASESKATFSAFYALFIKDLSKKGITFPEVGKVDTDSYFIHGLIVAEKETYSNNKRSIECITKLFYSAYLNENKRNIAVFTGLNTGEVSYLWAMKNSADIQALRTEVKEDIKKLRDEMNEKLNAMDKKFTKELTENFAKVNENFAKFNSQLESFINEMRSKTNSIEETQRDHNENTNSSNVMNESPKRKTKQKRSALSKTQNSSPIKE